MTRLQDDPLYLGTEYRVDRDERVVRNAGRPSEHESYRYADKSDPPKEAYTKPTNPKDMQGIKKTPLSCVPIPVVMEVGVGMLEGALKYGRFNWRSMGVRASVYFDATMRHLVSWWEGEDIDPQSQLSHVTKAITSLMVLRDAMIQGMFEDDRPLSSKEFMTALDERTAKLIEQARGLIPPHHFTIKDKK